MKKLRWGILSTAKIAREHMIPALQSSACNEVVAIASRTQQHADEAASALQIGSVYNSYEALLADPRIDAIYNPLPNHLHVPWSIKALNAGKHVLCEKPLGLTAQDIEPLLATAKLNPQLHMMEAFMYRFHPQWQAALQLVSSGAIGQVRSIHTHFAYNNHEAANIRHFREMGGGVLMDIGCYCISLSRFIFNEEPLRVLAQSTPYAGYEVDCFVSAIMEFADGNATFSVSSKTEDDQHVKIHGEQGSIFIPRPFNPVADQETHILLTQHRNQQTITQAPANHYREMADAFAQSIFNNSTTPTPLSDALANMKIIDAVFASVVQNQWISIE